MKTYLCTWLGAVVVALVSTPIVIRLARRLKLYDRPGVRKVHSWPVPRLGGLPIAVAALGMIVSVFLLDNVIGRAFRDSQTQLIAILAAAAFMLLVGLIDDIRGLRARTKLIAQLAAAAAVCGFGVRITSFSVAGWFTLDLGWLAWPVTIFWIMGMTNAVNLIDGLDGLAAGISAVACGVIAVFALYSGQPVMAVLMLALLGSLVGFLVFNFNPAKIFLGDSGTHFLGFILGAASVMCAVKSTTLVGLALPALALGLPIFDTLFSIIRRFLERRSLFAPDRSHIHHRLLELGLRQRHVVLIMYAATLLAAAFGMLMILTRDARAVAVLASVLLLLLLLFRLVGAVRVRQAFAVLQQNRAIARQARQDRAGFEQAQLLLREARSFDAWWQGVCLAAGDLEFARLSLPLINRDGTRRMLTWHHAGPESAPDEILRMDLPIRDRRAGPPLRLGVAISVNGSVESGGRRLALFSRLLDEHGLASLLQHEA